MSEPISHVDQVDHAENVISAEHVGLAQALEVHAVDRAKDRVRTIGDLTKNLIVLIAVVGIIFNYVNSGRARDADRAERTALTAKLDAATNALSKFNQKAADTTNCARRLQDEVDRTFTDVVVTIGELVVTITQVEPGPARVTAVAAKVTELKSGTIAARQAVANKKKWNDDLNPLPCPI